MSLFGGGPANDAFQETQATDGLSIIVEEEPSGAGVVQVPTSNQQASPVASAVTDSPREDDTEDEEEDEEDSYRFKGPPRTWHRYTAAERRVATSVEHSRAEDLSAHLFNAFAFKKQARPPRGREEVKDWYSRHRWHDEKREMDWVPPAYWTAWPLRLENVPGSDEVFGVKVEDGLDEWTTKRGHDENSKQRLEEELAATFLRQAKRRFHERQFQQLAEREETNASQETETENVGGESAPTEDSQSQDSKHAEETMEDAENPPTDATPLTEMHDINDPSRSSPTVSRREYQSGTSFRSETSDHDEYEIESVGETKKLNDQTFMPMLSADDDRAHRIIQPSVNSIISRLDRLLLALHQSREDQRLAIDTESDDDDEEDDAPPQLRGRHSARETNDPDGGTAMDTSRPSSSRRGRPNVYGKPLPGESYYMMRKRLDSTYRTSSTPGNSRSRSASRRKVGETDHSGSETASTTARKRSRSRQRTRSRPTSADETGDESDFGGIERSGLRDWSEVLGLASLVGWNERVVERAAQRCSVLFREGIHFRTLPENDAADMPGEIVEYLPDNVPSPGKLDAMESSTLSSEEHRPYWDPSSLRCPHENCWGHLKEFKIPYRVVEHIQRTHGYDPRHNETHEDDEMEGAVHVDGFLRPIHARQGWRGANTGDSKKRTRKSPGMEYSLSRRTSSADSDDSS